MGSIAPETQTPICYIVTPVGNLGYGFDQSLLLGTLEQTVPTGIPTAIILDSGSTDSGPGNLGLGKMTCPRSGYERDLGKLLEASHRFKVPILIGSAGGDGSDDHVKEMSAICSENAAKPGNEQVHTLDTRDYDFKVISLYGGVAKEMVTKRLAEGILNPCGRAVPPATQADIAGAAHVVAQMGPEAFIKVIEAVPDYDILLGGRAYDPAPYIAFAIQSLHRVDPKVDVFSSPVILGGFTHMGKIMECGGQCAKPKSAAALATVYADGSFDVKPLDADAKCTSLSVAAHTFYEKTRPDKLAGPGGYLDLTAATYEELPDGISVRCKGGIFHTSASQGNPYQVKLEAAKVTGYRSFYMGSIRDPILIKEIDHLLKQAKWYAGTQVVGKGEWQLEFHVYGRTGRIDGEPADIEPDEVFIVGEVLADTQALATQVCEAARIATVHGPYPGQKATSGNFCFGIAGVKTVEQGLCPEFCLYHLMDLQPGEEFAADMDGQPVVPEPGKSAPLFKWKTQKVGKALPKATVNGNGTFQSASESQEASDASKAKSSSQKPKIAEKAVDFAQLPIDSTTLGDVASVLRSKNAGPYELTFDVIFQSEQVYRIIKDANILTEELVQKAFDISLEEVLYCGFFDQARGWKATIPRKRGNKPTASGNFGERDVHGSQQYIPFLRVKVPPVVVKQLQQVQV
ncbi:uncharacterized protein Z518_04021 [Rhinocladiella mackenziei CBS 650.93]|uniref:Uncharacterized protein n=1 Tax=Rhinocladiella mackenziei CBS 650.93 TaxID=1442369 RepID=A0A0D2FVC5_9EURO|nr:uncharacterized protein Z518_04021 [Rhinocladiella mackenziei CBS 650.93]KIX06047.1 hypothetical protein Z518_04021 [Rhinocladiella mackenziei CBS 650.93]